MRKPRRRRDNLEYAVMSVKVPVYQKEYLRVHCELSGNKLSEIIRALIDYYIEVQ